MVEIVDRESYGSRKRSGLTSETYTALSAVAISTFSRRSYQSNPRFVPMHLKKFQPTHGVWR